jgi:hypothetical protein
MRPSQLTWLMPPNRKQLRRISDMKDGLVRDGIPFSAPHEPSNRKEARDLIYKLRMIRRSQ